MVKTIIVKLYESVTLVANLFYSVPRDLNDKREHAVMNLCLRPGLLQVNEISPKILSGLGCLKDSEGRFNHFFFYYLCILMRTHRI